MRETDQGSRKAGNPAAVLRRMPTGAKVFLILGFALLPLALIGLLATLQTTRITDLEARSRLRVAIVESSRALAIELIGNITALRVALNTLDDDPGNAPSCARVEGVFTQQFAAGARFQIADRSGRLLCGAPVGADMPPRPDPGDIAVRVLPGRGLALALTGRRGTTAAVFYPSAYLANVARPTGFTPAYGSTLVQGEQLLELEPLESRSALERRERMRRPLQFGGLELEMAMRAAPITSPLIVTMLLPLLMLVLAAGISWFVVDRLLIRPLRRLNASVRDYQPGEVVDPIRYGPLPAAELRELGDTFREISRTVQAHEADLAEGLVRQTRLTREVHHRVKNNLQVIASLINFHARGARSPDALDAYASIQRRVDALAVVHRYHYAEMEENRGLELRSVIGELASNIRATAPEGSHNLGITLEVEPMLVSQDVGVAVAFLLTELVELAMSCNPVAQIRISLKPDPEASDRAVLRVSSPALVESPALEEMLERRYGRVIGGLVRQLRSKLHHDPLVGAYEASVAILGRA